MKLGLLVRIEAKPEHADEVEATAAALGEAAKTKLSAPPVIAKIDLLGSKVG